MKRFMVLDFALKIPLYVFPSMIICASLLMDVVIHVVVVCSPDSLKLGFRCMWRLEVRTL